MSDYSKINLRLSNAGLNIAHTPESLQFGQWTKFLNAWSEYEGQVTARRGISAMNEDNPGSAVLGMRRVNDSVNSKSFYILKMANGKWYVSTDTVSGLLSTTVPFDFLDTTASAGSSVFGSFVIERPTLSSSVFCYAGDRSAMYKFATDTGGGLILKNVGITRPVGPPTFVVSAGGSLTASSTYNYRYTLFDKNTGTESLHNSTEATADATTAANKTITVTIPTEVVDAATTHVRVYRNGGTLSAWNRISDDSATYAYTGTTINFADSASDLSIQASTVLDDLSDKPFSITQTDSRVFAGQALSYLFGPYLGYILAVGDPLNPGFLYWMNKYTPDSQNPANNIEVTSPQDPLQNGLIFDGKPFIFSKEGLYAVYPGISEDQTFTPSKTACGKGLWSPHAFCVGPQIYFLGNDGIYATSGGLEQALTDNDLRPLFDSDLPAATQTINGIGVVDYTATSYMFMAYYKNEVYFQYLGKDSSTHVLIYDVRYHRWRHMKGALSGVNIRSMYADEQVAPNLIFGGNDGSIYEDTGFNDGGVAVATSITTGLITLGAPLIHKEFGALVVDLDPKGATVTVDAYKDRGATLIDGGSGYTGQSSAAARTRLFISLADTFSEDLQINFSWSSSTVAPIIYGYELFFRPDVPQMNRWSLTGTDHGILGWQILRSGYFTLRSDGTVILAITYDTNTGAVFSYTIPTTSNNKVKVFVPFDPLKGKSWSYSLALGTATYFRFYPNESEVHVKPWISSFGYKTVNPFAGGAGGNISTDMQQGGQGLGGGLGGAGGSSGLSMNPPIPTFDFSGLGSGLNIGPIPPEGQVEGAFPRGGRGGSGQTGAAGIGPGAVGAGGTSTPEGGGFGNL